MLGGLVTQADSVSISLGMALIYGSIKLRERSGWLWGWS